MAQKLSSKGFTAIETTIVILVVAVLAFGGWFIWSKTRKKDNTSTNSTTTQNQNQKNANKDQQTTDQSDGGKYLVIKEWKVRLPLSESLRGDAEYGIFLQNNGDQIAYFASKKVAAKTTTGDCGLTETSDSNGHGMFGGAMALSRSASKPSDDENPELIFQKDGYWYTLGFANGGACYEGDTGAETGIFKSAMTAAARALESIE